MTDLHTRLFPGDDVIYITPSSQEKSYGRIIAAKKNSFTIQCYDSSAQGLPAVQSMPFIHILELRLTNRTESIPRVNVEDVCFILSEQDIKKHPFSLVGMRRVRFIRFSIDNNSNLNPLNEWSSFRNTGPLSYPYSIWSTITEIQMLITKRLNVGTMTQRQRASLKTSCTDAVFDYIKRSVVDSELISLV